MKRDSYWDSLKFILIFLVVFAHSIASYKPIGGINQALYNFLCTFLMPAFIFVSGMFSQMKDMEKYKSGILRIFETYVVFLHLLLNPISYMIESGRTRKKPM